MIYSSINSMRKSQNYFPSILCQHILRKTFAVNIGIIKYKLYDFQLIKSCDHRPVQICSWARRMLLQLNHSVIHMLHVIGDPHEANKVISLCITCRAGDTSINKRHHLRPNKK